MRCPRATDYYPIGQRTALEPAEPHILWLIGRFSSDLPSPLCRLSKGRT